MKWPESILFIRHATSAYNILKDEKKANAVYQQFLVAYESNPHSDETIELAKKVRDIFDCRLTGDADTPLIDEDCRKTAEVARSLRARHPVPDVIFYSPYKRTKQTLAILKNTGPSWKALGSTKRSACASRNTE